MSVKEHVNIPHTDLEKMKSIELEMLIELDRICRKYGIRYNICSGTLLGAVRHKGFIPWDDDIDICMLRSEYIKFCRACEKDLDNTKFFLQNRFTDPGYRWQFGRILRKGTQYIRVGQEKLQQNTGVFIDIFISDGLPDNVIEKQIYNFLAWSCRKTLWSPVGVEVEKNPFKRLIFILLSHVPAKIPFGIFDFLSRKYNEKNCDRMGWMGLKKDVSVFDSQKIQQKGVKKEWHLDLIELEFEGHLFFAPRQYHEWLVEDFGDDYIQLPPPEKRILHHTVSMYKLLENDS